MRLAINKIGVLVVRRTGGYLRLALIILLGGRREFSWYAKGVGCLPTSIANTASKTTANNASTNASTNPTRSQTPMPISKDSNNAKFTTKQNNSIAHVIMRRCVVNVLWSIGKSVGWRWRKLPSWRKSWRRVWFPGWGRLACLRRMLTGQSQT